MTGAVMWWLYWCLVGGGILVTFLCAVAPMWRGLLRAYPPDERDSAAVFWAQHSSSHG